MHDSGAVAIIGAGTMGRQIAMQLAAHGSAIHLFDVDDAARARAVDQIGEELTALIDRGWLPGPARDDIERIRPVESLAAAIDGSWMVLEAVPERIEIKRPLFARLSEVAGPEVVLATNSSSFKSRLLVDVTRHPERLMNVHFFNFPWERSGVEIMSCGMTDPELMARVHRFLRGHGLVPVMVEGESTGFLYNRIWRAVKRESLRAVAQGHGEPIDIDRLYCLATGARIGPFALMDQVGLDVVLDIERHYARESGDPNDEPPEFLVEMVREGRLGRKSGSGFYEYPNPPWERDGWPRDGAK
jgi:3-hydroxybutyryl-CoA dehydrogenase